MPEVAIVPRPWIQGLIRADAGFYSEKILRHIETMGVKYIAKSHRTTALMARILNVRRWYRNDTVSKDASYTEFRHKATPWKQERRIVVVRVRKEKCTKETNRTKQMNLFKGMETVDKYDYMAFVTNDMESALHIHAKYIQRGDCENRIRELKYDYAIDGFCLQHFGAMEAVFRLIMVAYNLMQIFKQAVMTSDRLSYQRTIRFQWVSENGHPYTSSIA